MKSINYNVTQGVDLQFNVMVNGCEKITLNIKIAV